jgi:hypothetical protein
MPRLANGAVGVLITGLLFGPIAASPERSGPPGTPQTAFQLACSTLPFEAIKKPRPIDGLCGL